MFEQTNDQFVEIKIELDGKNMSKRISIINVAKASRNLFKLLIHDARFLGVNSFFLGTSVCNERDLARYRS